MSSVVSLAVAATSVGAQATAQGGAVTEPARPAASGTALKQLDPADLAFWKNIRSASVSTDGRWFAYQLAPNEGDAEVVVRPTGDGSERRFKIGEPPPPAGGFGAAANTSVVISDDAKWVAFAKYPAAAEAKKLRKDRKPVQSGVVLLNLATGDQREFDKVRRFAFASKRPNWLVMHRYAPDGAAAGAGADLLLLDLRSGTVTSVGNVGDFALDESGGWLAWTIEGRDLVGNGVQVRDLRTDVVRVLDSDKAVYRRLAWADSGLALGVLRGRPDSAAADTSFVVLGYTGFGASNPKAVLFTPTDTGGFPSGFRVTPDRAPRWAADRSAIYFGIAARRTSPESKTPRPDVRPAAGVPGAMQATGRGNTADEDELASLVIWHGKDPRLQSQQQVEESRDKAFTFLAGYRVSDRRFVRLGTDDTRDATLAPNERWAIGVDVRGYERAGNIDGLRFRDLYVIDTRTGERKLAVKKTPFRDFVSPDGSRLLYFEDGQYRVYDMAAGTSRVITANAPVTFVDTEDDHNMDRPPVAPLGWAKDGSAVLLSDNWDIWRVPVRGGAAVNLTTDGRAKGVRYQRRVVIDPQERGIDLSKPIYLSMYGERTKKEGLAVVSPSKPGATTLVWDDARYNFTRARDAETWVFTRQTVKDFPDYWTGAFSSPRRLTTANPQQSEYAWSSGARLVDYVTDKGDSLQGALYLPANYEPGKRYPTVVYIYEKRSQFLHAYSVPNETQAFNPSVYTSRGYAVFQPDIVYKVNDPGMSAVWAVVPAVKGAIATGIVDSANVALHGHSWGGYQTAFLVTQTNIFKSAIAGAALTDMVSMYSSVYWNTGGGNMAIFESSQGRFKGNFIENYDAYIRNSPAFHAHKITTPLLLLHNERDGAVDFNQGITFFNTLRELGKDVVLLQYVGENHGLQQPRNQKDYTIRMREFFDHYLKGTPAPDWLKDGIPRLKMDEHLKSRQKKTEKIAS